MSTFFLKLYFCFIRHHIISWVLWNNSIEAMLAYNLINHRMKPMRNLFIFFVMLNEGKGTNERKTELRKKVDINSRLKREKSRFHFFSLKRWSISLHISIIERFFSRFNISVLKIKLTHTVIWILFSWSFKIWILTPDASQTIRVRIFKAR